MSKNKLYDILTILAAIGISLGIAFVIIFAASKQPLESLGYLLYGPIRSFRDFSSVLVLASTITFTGLAVSIMFQASQFNVGAEGGFFLGAVVAMAISVSFVLPTVVHQIVSIMAAAVVGALFSAIPGILKTKWNANVLVTSLMLNYIALYIGLYLVNNLFRDTQTTGFSSYKFADTSILPTVLPKTNIHFGLLIAVVMIMVACFFLYKTKLGYSIRMVGHNQHFAKYSGIKTGVMIVASQAIGGAFAGMGGAVEMLGMYTRFKWQALPGYGWDGVIVAILARNNPVFVPIAALFIAYLRIGSDIMARMTDVPTELIYVIQAIMLMFVTSSSLLGRFRRKAVVKEALCHGNTIKN